MATLAAWCMALFFLWYGLAAFVPALIVGLVGLLVLLGMG